ncbi:MAG: hypothetical protein WCX81_07025 [Monoglobales bacterium]
MKKMTKILSLALALVLVLGITSFAGTTSGNPTYLIVADDLDAATDINSFLATKSVTTNTDLLAATPFVSSYRTAGATSGQMPYHFLVNKADWTIERVNGKNRLSEKNAYRAKQNQIMLMPSEPIALSELESRKVALVATAGWTPTEANASTTVNYSVLTGIKWRKMTDDVETEDKRGKFSILYLDPGLLEVTAQGGTKYRNIELGTEHTLETVVRSWNLWNHNTVDGESASGVVFSSIDGLYKYADHFSEPVADTDRISALWFGGRNYLGQQLYDIKFYEVSLDAADFYIDTEATKSTNIGINDDIVIEFSQPVSKGIKTNAAGADLTNGHYIVGATLAEMIKVMDGENELVNGTDFTVNITDKIVGSQVKGVVTIDMAGTMPYGHSYTVVFPKNLCNVAYFGSAATDAEAKTITVTTEATPTFNITLAANKGLNATGSSVTADNLDGTVYFSANATNATGRAVDGVIVIGIYDADDNLIKYAAASSKTFADGAAKAFGAAFKVEAGQKVKAFVKGTSSIIDLD